VVGASDGVVEGGDELLMGLELVEVLEVVVGSVWSPEPPDPLEQPATSADTAMSRTIRMATRVAGSTGRQVRHVGRAVLR
jgi:hypothetical protein